MLPWECAPAWDLPSADIRPRFRSAMHRSIACLLPRETVCSGRQGHAPPSFSGLVVRSLDHHDPFTGGTHA